MVFLLSLAMWQWLRNRALQLLTDDQLHTTFQQNGLATVANKFHSISYRDAIRKIVL